MTAILHCADLHLSDGPEREYGLAVFDEVLALARDRRVDCVLVCGDLFDSFDDALALRAAVRERLARAASACPVVYVPGNHEELRRGERSLESLDLGALVCCYARPFEIRTIAGIELLCIPHQADYRGYVDPQRWAVPPRQACPRVALFHGLVGGMNIYAGPVADEETPAGIIDPDLFARFGVDFAAGGHIHRRLEKRIGPALVSYPGSARVWRSGEDGPRGVNLVTVGPSIDVRFIALPSAGRYLEYRFALELDASLDGLAAIAAQWSGADWVSLRLSGLVEDENAAAGLEARIRAAYAGRVRRLDIDRSEVAPVPGILSQPLAAAFIERWKKTGTDETDAKSAAVLRAARRLGLEEIRSAMEAG